MMLLPVLRDDQEKVVKEVLGHISRKQKRIIVVAPTGTGKTMMGAALTATAVDSNCQVAFVVPRDTLIKQTVKTMSWWGLRCGIIAGGRKEDRTAPVQVCSFQTLGRARDLSWLKPRFVIADECHMTSFTNVLLSWFPFLDDPSRNAENESYYLGLTATPWRLDKRESLGQIFNVLVTAPTYEQLIKEERLVRPVYYRIKEAPSGDMAADIDYIVSQWFEIAQNDLTFAFTASIDFAEATAQKFLENGVEAAAITEKTSRRNRDRLFDKFANNEIKVLSTVSALCEGVDIPAARVAILARNLKSRSLYVQSVGRVARTHTYPDGTIKTDCIVMDQMNLVRKFGLVEDIVVSKHDLELPDNSEPGLPPVKECPRCHKYSRIAATECKYCHLSFEIIGSKRFQPTGRMDRSWRSHQERQHFARYQRLLKKGYLLNKPLGWADEHFRDAFGYYAPKDWRRLGAINSNNEEERNQYKQYLEAIAKQEARDPAWLSRQLSLDLGITK